MGLIVKVICCNLSVPILLSDVFDRDYAKQKSRVPEYRMIFRQPGCLREILKAFRPTLAGG
jgi:hypothetical protein